MKIAKTLSRRFLVNCAYANIAKGKSETRAVRLILERTMVLETQKKERKKIAL